MAEPRLFLDADGVLADFDEGAKRLLGMTPRAYEAKHGRGSSSALDGTFAQKI